MIPALILAAAVTLPARPSDYVTDTAGTLSSQTAQQIRDELRTYERSTGHLVLVWIGQTTGDTPLEDWTIHAVEKWKPGDKKLDDGAVLFVFMQDRRVRIEVGYGLEATLTDASASAIIRDVIVPKMRANDVDGAIRGGVDRMLLTITPSFKDKIGHEVATAGSDQSVDPTRELIAIVIIALILFGVFGLLLYALFSKKGRGLWYVGSGPYMGGGWGSGSSGFSGGGFSGSFGGGFGGGGASGSW